MYIVAMGWKLNNGITNKLTRSMEGYIPTPLDWYNWNFPRVDDALFSSLLATHREDWRMSTEEKSVGYAFIQTLRKSFLHKRMCMGI
jgi:hypothetical protein